MDVGEICTRIVVYTHKELVLNEAARLMRNHHVGSLVVVQETDAGRIPIGMLTDRDIVIGVVAAEVDARTLSVGEVMSADLVCVREHDSVFDALRAMRGRGIRRVSVTDAAGALAGILAVDDVLEIISEQLHDIVRAIGSERTHEARTRG